MADQTLLLAVVAAGLGAVACFAGQRLFALLLVVGGFAAGFALALAVAPPMVGGDRLLVLAAGVLGGLVGALLVRAFFHAAMLLAFGALGGSAGAAVAVAVGMPHLTTPAVVVGGVTAVLLAAILQAPRWLVIGATSLAGASAMVIGAGFALGRVSAELFVAAVESLRTTLDPSQPLLPLVVAVLTGRWLDALGLPAAMVGSQPVLVATIAVFTVAGVIVQAGTAMMLPPTARRATGVERLGRAVVRPRPAGPPGRRTRFVGPPLRRSSARRAAPVAGQRGSVARGTHGRRVDHPAGRSTIGTGATAGIRTRGSARRRRHPDASRH